MSDPLAITRRWVKDIVIDLNLCPFARRPFEAETIRYTLCRATEPDTIYRDLISKIGDFALANPETDETALFIVPQGLESFDDYLDMLEDAQTALDMAGLDGMLQLASFHPDYLFEDCDDHDPANYTNRSPYPMFHLIRQDGMAAALADWIEPESIPERNIARLRAMGLREMRRRLAAITGERAESE